MVKRELVADLFSQFNEAYVMTTDFMPRLSRLKEVSAKLDLEERNLFYFFQRSPDLCAIINSDGSFVRLNESWHKLLGWEDLDNTPWTHLIHHEDQGLVREFVGHLSAHDVQRFVCRLRCSDGSYVAVELSASKWSKTGCSNIIGRVVPDLCTCCPMSPRLQWRPNGCINDWKQQAERA
jgi:PAS domain S-box-containing protein